MNNQLRTFGVAALLAQSLVLLACSSSGSATGSGGTTGAQAGATGAQGGSSGTAGMTGSTPVVCAAFPGSCTCTAANPDSMAGGACADGAQSVSSGLPCTQDCCVSCGIDAMGIKTCLCPNPGQPYSNCSCPAPAGFPTGPGGAALTGGLCSPQGYAATTPPAGATLPTLKGVPCTKVNTVCFTADSKSGSERGCICLMDATGTASMHCGSVNHWFTNNNDPATTY